MRTRAQALLSGDGEVAAATRKRPSPSPQGLIDRIKLKISSSSSNGRYGTRSQVLREQQERDVKIVLKRKASSPHPEEAALVIKKHKRGIQSRRRQRRRRRRDKGGGVGDEEEGDEEQEEEDEEDEDGGDEEEEAEEECRRGDDERKQQQSSRKNSSLSPKNRVGRSRSRRPTPAAENLSPSRDDRAGRAGGEEQERKGGGDVKKAAAAAAAKKVCCTVNTDMVADRSEASISSDPSCSFDSMKRSAGDDGLVAAMRAPLFVPAKRSPLPFPLPPAAAPPPTPLPPPPAAAAAPPPPPAVRSALPAPPAMRSALPLPCVDETAAAAAAAEIIAADEKGDFDDDEVDIHGFSSAIAAPRGDRSSEEDGMSLPEEEMLSPMFFGPPWHDDGSMNGLLEMRKRGGPGSRATYRCSRCLAPKKGHRCPFEAESPVPESETKSEVKSEQVKKSSTDPTTSNEIQQRHPDAASPSKSNEPSNHNEESSKPAARATTKAAAMAAAAGDPVVKEFSVSAKWLLESGVLEGLTVRYMPRAGEVLGTGTVKGGVILCSCRQCKSHQGFNASSFEKHVGSTARHPSDFIFLDNGRRLREVLEDGSRFRDKPNMMSALRKAVSADWDAS